MSDVFQQNHYLIRRKILAVLGQKFHIYDSHEQLIGYCKQKAFKLKEDIRIYTDESMSTELLVIKARQVIDIAATYDIVDPADGSKVGALRRKALKSMLRDTWEVLDDNDQQIGELIEDSQAMALLRRFLSNLIPQSFNMLHDGVEVVQYRQNFNPFVLKLNVEILDPETVDPRLALGAGILLAAIEGRQG